MSLAIHVTAAAGLLLAGCAGIRPIEPQDPPPRRISVGWIRQDWRICNEDDSCPRPTPKTIVPAAPIPTAGQLPTTEKPRPTMTTERKPAIVHFVFAQATPTEAGAAQLDGLLSQIRERDAIHIVGHTDDIGSLAVNERLANRRAEFVTKWLKRRGIRNPMDVEARGKCCYVAANDSEEGRAANRRVEIHFTTNQKEIVR